MSFAVNFVTFSGINWGVNYWTKILRVQNSKEIATKRQSLTSGHPAINVKTNKCK